MQTSIIPMTWEHWLDTLVQCWLQWKHVSSVLSTICSTCFQVPECDYNSYKNQIICTKMIQQLCSTSTGWTPAKRGSQWTCVSPILSTICSICFPRLFLPCTYLHRSDNQLWPIIKRLKYTRFPKPKIYNVLQTVSRLFYRVCLSNDQTTSSTRFFIQIS